MRRFATFLLVVLTLFALAVPALASDGVVVNLENGNVLSGIYQLIVSGRDDISLSIDGVSLDVSVGLPRFLFTAAKVDYDGGNIYYNDTAFTSIPSTDGSYAIEFDSSAFASGDITLTYVPSSSSSNAFEYGKGQVYGTYNLDDQEVSGVSIILPNGKSVIPKSVILHYPVVGTGDTRDVTEAYDPNKVYSIGDGWSADTGMGGSTPNTPLYVSFVFSDLTEKIASSQALVAQFDTTTFADGEHILSITSGNETLKEVKFRIDNTGPTIDLDLPFGTALYLDEVIKFSATDLSGNATVKADIDGKTYSSGGSLAKISLGQHLLTVTAVDRFGNSSTVCTEFVLCEKSAAIESGLEKQTATPTIKGDRAEYVYHIGNSRSFTFEYLGTTSENGPISISAYDYTKKSYVEIATAQSGVRCVVTVKDKKYIKGGEVKIAVCPKKYVSVSDTVVWITDTQYYSKFDDLHNVYELVLNYSVDLYKKGQAGYLIHTGDIVDTPGTGPDAQNEWKFADEVHKILDNAGMPNGIIAGNHDTGNYPPDLTMFKKYFPASRFEGNLWYGGNLDNNACHYDLITIAETDYLFLYLSNGIEAEERTIAWANAVCKAYPDRTVIICVHPYLSYLGEYVENNSNPSSYDDSRAAEIMEYIIKPNSNVAAVFCGHDHGAQHLQKDLGNGRYIWEILSDYQFAETGRDPKHMLNGMTCDGEGYLRLITFGKNGAMAQTTYSPLNDDYNYFAEKEDTFNVTLQVGKKTVSLATKEAAIHFADTPLALGDLSGNGKIDVTDYMMLKRAVLGTLNLSEQQREVADINGDGKVNSVDYIFVKRAVLGTYVIA